METAEPTGSFLYDSVLPNIERVSWILAVIGFAAAWFQLRNADYLLIVGLGGLSNVYMLKPFSPLQIAADNEQYFSANQSEQYNGQIASTDVMSHNFDTVRRQITAFGSAATFGGILFRLMAWEHNTNILLFGEACLLIAILSLALKQRTNRQLLLLAALGGLTLYIPAETWIHQFHGNDPILVQKMIYQLNHPDNRAVAKDVYDYQHQKRAQR